LLLEADCVRAAAERLSSSFTAAVELLHRHRGNIVVTGVGKSGDIGRKIASTFRSIGKAAIYLSAVDATHGDLGMYQPGDPTIMLSKSGATAELLQLLPALQKLSSPLIAIVGNLSSPLARAAAIVLDARVPVEADHLNVAPTCSTTVTLALGDALAVALMRMSDLDHREFANFHPSGQLGRNLTMRVNEAMHPLERIAVVRAIDSLHQVVIEMTSRPLGAACVLDERNRLIGLITDGDLRRVLQHHPDIRGLSAGDCMTQNPAVISPAALLQDAAALMESRPSQISVLPVVDETRLCHGLLRLHDLYWHTA
jgi:arabinose-5-phosphate isomerase